MCETAGRGPLKRIKNSPRLLAAGAVLVFLNCLTGGTVRGAKQYRSTSVAAIGDALRARNFQEALRLTRSAIADSPNDPQLLTMQAIALAGLGEGREALTAYDAALRLAPNYLPALEGAAQIEYDAGDDSATALLNRILKISPNDATSHAMLGVLAYKKKDCKAAIGHFQAAGEIAMSQPSALEELGFCLVRTGRLADAVRDYETLVSISPTPRARIHLSAAQVLNHQPNDALTTLAPILQQTQPDAEALDIASKAAEMVGGTPRAVQFMRRAIVTDPGNPNYYLDFATLAFDHSSFQVGIDVLNAGISRLPKSAPLYLARGILHIQLAQYEKGEADFEAADRLDPRQSFSSESESLAKIQENGAAGALNSITAQLKAHPHDPVLLYLFADSMDQNGAQPGTPDFESALRAAQQAVELRPDLHLARNLLAKLYYEDGQLSPAIEQCRITLRSNPTDQEALYRLVQSLRKTGKTSEIPDLLKRLATLREKERENEASKNRYKLVEPSASNPARE
ncbi:MAG TPA: tetratricopeptide repeat protein [Candidatus Acidoferrales bacterium]|nr:tetratricopeptide repeat protein [Candidatus Acidoferrales bacterium]